MLFSYFPKQTVGKKSKRPSTVEMYWQKLFKYEVQNKGGTEACTWGEFPSISNIGQLD